MLGLPGPVADHRRLWPQHPTHPNTYGIAQGGIEQKELLGNKGANLCEMTKQGCVPHRTRTHTYPPADSFHPRLD